MSNAIKDNEENSNQSSNSQVSSNQVSNNGKPEELKDPLTGSIISSWRDASDGGPFKTSVWIAATIAALTILFGQLLIAKENAAVYALICYIFGATVLSVYSGVLLFRSDSPKGLTQRWRVLRQPVKQEWNDKIKKLIDMSINQTLEVVTDVAANNESEYLKIEKKHIRGNIFLPDYRQALYGVAMELAMPNAFRRQMTDVTEWGLRLLPGEGAVGVSFENRQPVITDNPFYGIDNKRKQQLVTKSLCGIIAIPILNDETEDVLAVLAIDFVEAKISIELLDRIYEKLSTPINGESTVDQVGNVLRKLDKAWLTITLND